MKFAINKSLWQNDTLGFVFNKAIESAKQSISLCKASNGRTASSNLQ